MQRRYSVLPRLLVTELPEAVLSHSQLSELKKTEPEEALWQAMNSLMLMTGNTKAFRWIPQRLIGSQGREHGN